MLNKLLNTFYTILKLKINFRMAMFVRALNQFSPCSTKNCMFLWKEKVKIKPAMGWKK